MSSDSGRRGSSDHDQKNVDTTGRIPKKNRGDSLQSTSLTSIASTTTRLQHDDPGNSDSNNPSNSNVKSKTKGLDPVAEARKALAMYEEVSGEPAAAVPASTFAGGDRRKKKNSDHVSSASSSSSGPAGARKPPPTKQCDSQEQQKRAEELERRQKRRRQAEEIRKKFKPRIAVDPSHIL